MTKSLVKKKHWFHGLASSSKKKYIKKHPRSIYAGARTENDHSGATAYRMTIAHMRAEIKNMQEQLHEISHTDSRYMSMVRKLQMLQRKLQIFKRAH